MPNNICFHIPQKVIKILVSALEHEKWFKIKRKQTPYVKKNTNIHK